MNKNLLINKVIYWINHKHSHIPLLMTIEEEYIKDITFMALYKAFANQKPNLNLLTEVGIVSKSKLNKIKLSVTLLL